MSDGHHEGHDHAGRAEHDHGRGHDHGHGAAGGSTRTLALVATINVVGFVAELAGGLVFGSVALLSDAVHMLFDALAYVMAFGAALVAERYEVSDRWSYGLHRLEPLSAFLNGALLLPMVGFILYESYQRFLDPIAIGTGPTLAIEYTGIRVLDPITAALIALVIVWSAVKLLRGSGAIFLHRVPFDADAVRDAIAGIDGVEAVDDLHSWQVCSEITVATTHVRTTVETMAEREELVRRVHDVLDANGVNHATVELCPGRDERHTHLTAHGHR